MSFWNKNKLPAEYKEMTEEQIADLLNKGKENEGAVTAAKLEATNAQKEKERLEAEAADLRQKLAAKPNGEERPEERRTQTQDEGPITDTDWLTNGNTAFDKRVAPVAAIALHGAIGMAKMQADEFIRRQGPVNARLWNKYKDDVEKSVNGLPPEQRILPQTWINSFTFIKGMHLEEVAKEAQGAGDGFFSEVATSTGGGMPLRTETQNDTLTDQEKKIAARYGSTPERYLEQKKKMKFSAAE